MDDDLSLEMPTIDPAELAALLENADENDADAHDGMSVDEADVDDDEHHLDDEEEGVGASSAADNGAEQPLDDVAFAQLGKREAKLLGKKLYKRWKKLTKKASRGDDASRAEHGEGHKRKKKEKASKRESHRDSTKKKDRKRRNSSGDDDNGFNASTSLLADAFGGVVAASTLSTGTSAHKLKAPKAKTSAAKPSAAQKHAYYDAEAARIVQLMHEQRIRDENARRVGQPPLHRLSITDDVALQCRRTYMHRHLLEHGILEELTHWLYNAESKELGPLDLRSLALELLMCFEVRGIRKNGAPKEEVFDEAKAAKHVDDLDAYRGICREDLEKTSLGMAVNMLRTSSVETERNKAMATQLLQRLSRAFQHRRDDDDEAPPVVEVQWRCKNDPTVAPPFDPVVSASDAFQQRMFHPDPLDPLSYLRCPPRRYNKGYVTNLSHIKVNSASSTVVR